MKKIVLLFGLILGFSSLNVSNSFGDSWNNRNNPMGLGLVFDKEAVSSSEVAYAIRDLKNGDEMKTMPTNQELQVGSTVHFTTIPGAIIIFDKDGEVGSIIILDREGETGKSIGTK